MRTAPLMLVLLVAAALAGCTGGASGEGQSPNEDPDKDTSTGSPTNTTRRSPGEDRGQRTHGNQTYDAHLEVSPDNGTAPLNVTLDFDVTWSDSGQHAGQPGNGTAGNGTGSSNRTSTGDPGQHPLNPGQAKNMTWTLEVRFNGTATGTGTSANGTADGNGTGNQTGGASSGNATAHGTMVASFNGTGEELPSNRTVTLEDIGSYDAVFTVELDDGSDLLRRHRIIVSDLPPGTPLGNETRTFEGSVLVSVPAACPGSEEFGWVLNETFESRPAGVSQLNLTLESGGLGSWEMTLVAPNGTEVGAGEEIHAEGPFEAGNYTLTVEACLAADSDFTVTAIAHYVTRTS